MTKSKQNKEHGKLKSLELDGRMTIAGVEDILDGLNEISADIKEALIDGVEPFDIVLAVLDELDYLKLACTVPACYVRKNIIARLENGERLAERLGDKEHGVASSELISGFKYTGEAEL